MEQKQSKLNPLTSLLMENLVDDVTDFGVVDDDDPIINYLKNQEFQGNDSGNESTGFVSDDSDIEVLIEEHILLEKLKQVSGKTQSNEYNAIHNISQVAKEEEEEDEEEEEVKTVIRSTSSAVGYSVAELITLRTKIEEAMQMNLKMREELLGLERKLMLKHRESNEQMKHNTKSTIETNKTMKFFPFCSERFFDSFRSPYFKHNGASAPLSVEADRVVATNLPHLFEIDEWNSTNVDALAFAIRRYLILEKITSQQDQMNKSLLKHFVKSEEFQNLKDARLYDLVKNRDDDSLDWEIILNSLKRQISVKDCRQLWALHLRPSLKDWTDEEHRKLLKIAKENNLQDWNKISDELNSERTGYECFLRHQRTVSVDSKDGKWSKEEETHLNNVIEKVKIGNYISWDKVSYFIDTKYVEQIYAKWHGFQAPHITRGQFTEQEDRILLGMIYKFGADLKSVSAVLKNRSMAQLTARYKDHLLPQLSLKVGEWSLEEDERLLQLVEEHGEKKWAIIAKHFQTRSRIQIRHRYKLLKQKITENPDLNLKSIYRPKRPTSKKRASRNKSFFNKVITSNGKHVKSLIRKPEIKPVKRSKTIDKKLTQFFQMKFRTQELDDKEFPRSNVETSKSNSENAKQKENHNQLSSALLFSTIALRNLYETAETDDWSVKDRTIFHRDILDLWASGKNVQKDLIKWHTKFCSLFAAPVLLSNLEFEKWKFFTSED